MQEFTSNELKFMLIHFLTKSSACYFHRLCRGNITNFHESKQRQFEGCCHKAAREDLCPHEYNAGETGQEQRLYKRELKGARWLLKMSLQQHQVLKSCTTQQIVLCIPALQIGIPQDTKSGCDVEFVLFFQLPPNLDSGLTS